MFYNKRRGWLKKSYKRVAILVLVDSVLQYSRTEFRNHFRRSRNPCFSGQCFAIKKYSKYYEELESVAILVLVDSVLQSRVDFLHWWIVIGVAILVLVDSVLQ